MWVRIVCIKLLLQTVLYGATITDTVRSFAIFLASSRN